MKMIIKIVLLGILCSSCSSDDNSDSSKDINELELSKEKVNLSNIEGSATISLTSNAAWSIAAKDDAEWLSISPSSGNGNSSIRIMATDNSNGDTRQGVVIVSQTLNGSTIQKEITVGQLGANPDILLSYSTETLSPKGGIVLVSITSNIEWEVYIDEASNWITQIENTNARGFVTEECNLLVAPNNDVKRTGIAAIRSIGEHIINKKIELSQEASEASLSLMQDEYILPFKYETLTIPVDLGEYGTKYDISVTEDWITWDKDASTSAQIVLKLKNNDQSDFPRTTDVKVTNVNLSETVSIFQYGKPNPRIGDDLSAPVLAFPGAEGGGRFTIGGRGGIVYKVTNLSDYDKNEAAIQGSLRYGLDMQVPRTIIFDVSGYIDLKRPMQINNPDFSIIGQTAPGDGITLRYHELSIRHEVDNILIRFLRVRTGDKYNQEGDAISGRWFKNGIVDHVSGSWSIDEGMSFYGVKNFTLQWAITSESLNNSYHQKGSHGYGAMFSGDNASCHHMLIAHHSSRTPRMSALDSNLTPSNPSDNQGFTDMRNIVVYNWSGKGLGAHGGEYNPFNWVNNYFKAGPATGTGWKSWRVMAGSTTSRIYADGNFATANPQTYPDNWNNGIWDQMTITEEEKTQVKLNEPHPFSKVTTHSAKDAYLKVADFAGASLRRDATDQRIIQELRSGSATYKGSVDASSPGIIDKVSDTDGYPPLKALPAFIDTDNDGIPDVWEIAYGLDANNANDANEFSLDNLGRYSNLDVYFHNLVQHIVYYQNTDGISKEKK